MYKPTEPPKPKPKKKQKKTPKKTPTLIIPLYHRPHPPRASIPPAVFSSISTHSHSRSSKYLVNASCYPLCSSASALSPFLCPLPSPSLLY
ncbi:hypothetical protein EX30DRAFT_108261 [Ascodesmis nigricans]|uniref:Uncharacterized protein n=1 Tax=Ascodesmis nigricans TaxID=341454 RepID=A0A4S2MQF6_9PEZI|nr:hypothetical protein EX30DRAFT_108261 [Ascodesmis nigricans]